MTCKSFLTNYSIVSDYDAFISRQSSSPSTSITFQKPFKAMSGKFFLRKMREIRKKNLVLILS